MNGLGETNLLFVLGGIAALFAVTFFFFVRSLMETRDRKLTDRLTADDEPIERLELRTDEQMKPLGDFLRRTGLDIAPDQAVGWMVLASTVLACVLFLIRPEWYIGLVGI